MSDSNSRIWRMGVACAIGIPAAAAVRLPASMIATQYLSVLRCMNESGTATVQAIAS